MKQQQQSTSLFYHLQSISTQKMKSKEKHLIMFYDKTTNEWIPHSCYPSRIVAEFFEQKLNKQSFVKQLLF